MSKGDSFFDKAGSFNFSGFSINFGVWIKFFKISWIFEKVFPIGNLVVTTIYTFNLISLVFRKRKVQCKVCSDDHQHIYCTWV